MQNSNLKKLVVGYFADGPWSHMALERLANDLTIQVAFICARYDFPDPVLNALASIYKIDFITHPQINSDEFLEQMKLYNCDLFVSMSFNQIFRKRLFEYPRLNTINCHAGKLPYYRGRNILNWALINDEKEIGITVHYIDEGIDTGDILSQKILPITDEDDYSTLLERAYLGCSELLYESVKDMQIGKIIGIPQNEVHRLGSYCTARRSGDERLIWNQSSRDVFNFVRAICRPGPEARTYCEDIEIKINRVEWLPDAPVFKGIPGAVVGIESDGFFVKTIDSYVKVIEWSGVNKVRIGDRFK